MEEAGSVFPTLTAVPSEGRPSPPQSTAGAAEWLQERKGGQAAGCDDAHGDADVNVAAARSGNGGAGGERRRWRALVRQSWALAHAGARGPEPGWVCVQRYRDICDKRQNPSSMCVYRGRESSN